MTATAAFGSGKREGHDASDFYRRFAAPDIDPEKRCSPVDDSVTGRVWVSSSENMGMVPDRSVGLVFTSPPYHVGKDYDTDDDFDTFLGMLDRVWAECYRVLEPGGKIVVNVAALGRKPYLRFHDLVAGQLADHGFLSCGEIIWRKAAGAGGSCAWGTWRSAKNPTLRDLHEYLLVLSRGRFGRVRDGESTLTGPQFMESTLSIWDIPPASAKRIGHPAPFPVTLAERVINLYSYKDDVVLDPFLGSGTTAIAAENLGRRWIGFELDPGYALLADRRITANRPTPINPTRTPKEAPRGQQD